MKQKKIGDIIETLEERIDRVGNLFGVDPKILTSKANQQIILTCAERIGMAANRVLDSSVEGELALAGIESPTESLPPILDYTFSVRKYTELIDFAESIQDDGTTASFAKRLISEKIQAEQKNLTGSEQKYTQAAKKADNSITEKAFNAVRLKIQEYSNLLGQTLSEWGTANEETDLRAEEAKKSQGRLQNYLGLGPKIGRGETVESRAEPRAARSRIVRREESDDSEPVTYFSIRGRRFYSAPKAAELLGIDYAKIGYNNLSLGTLTELESAGKVKLVKREKGQATKVYREDALVELLPNKIRDRMDLTQRLNETAQQEYSGTFKVLKLADSGLTDGLPAAGGRREDPPTGEAPQKRKYQRRGITPSRVDRTDKPLRRKEGTPLPEELLALFSAEGLEQTVESAETLHFLAVNGTRLFPVREIKKAYEEIKTDRGTIPSSSYSANIILNQDKFPPGSLLTVRIMTLPEGKAFNKETSFVREDQVQLVVPKYVTDQFTDLTPNFSLKAYPLDYLDGESLAAEVKKYDLPKSLAQPRVPQNGRRKARVAAIEPVGPGPLPSAAGQRDLGAVVDAAASDALIPYEDLPSQLGGQYDMGTVDTACQALAGEGQLTLHHLIPDLGEDSPKGLKPGDLGKLRDYLTAKA